MNQRLWYHCWGPNRITHKTKKSENSKKVHLKQRHAQQHKVTYPLRDTGQRTDNGTKPPILQRRRDNRFYQKNGLTQKPDLWTNNPENRTNRATRLPRNAVDKATKITTQTQGIFTWKTLQDEGKNHGIFLIQNFHYKSNITAIQNRFLHPQIQKHVYTTEMVRKDSKNSIFGLHLSTTALTLFSTEQPPFTAFLTHQEAKTQQQDLLKEDQNRAVQISALLELKPTAKPGSTRRNFLV